MTRDETKTVLAMLASAYPLNLMPAVTEMTVNVWYQMLADLDYKPIQYAVAAWLQTNRYPPTIADIREQITREKTKGLTPEQAWSVVMNAVRVFGHTEKDLAQINLGKLWDLVGSDWAYYCTISEDQLPNEKARFIRMYTAMETRAKNQAQIAAPIRDALEGWSKAMLGDGK